MRNGSVEHRLCRRAPPQGSADSSSGGPVIASPVGSSTESPAGSTTGASIVTWLACRIRILSLAALAALSAGCVAGDAVGGPNRGNPASLPGWAEDDLDGLRLAIDAQCGARRLPAGWAEHCAELRSVPGSSAAQLREWIARRFTARALGGGSDGAVGLVTGYHEPEIPGSRTRTARFRVPLHRPPESDHPLARAPRAEIERAGGLAGHELAWVEDPVDAFFLQVQGSGRIRLSDGGVLRVGYAGNNGHAYRAIGSVLAGRGTLTREAVNAQAIKAWLRANPAEAASVMQSNPRYVFFRDLGPVPEASGPPGSMGVPLTPLRSIATDPARVPPGSLVWLDTTDPVDRTPLRRLVLAQDTGSAIVGEVRADLFWGSGTRAETAAGMMKQPGRMWLLEPSQRR